MAIDLSRSDGNDLRANDHAKTERTNGVPEHARPWSTAMPIDKRRAIRLAGEGDFERRRDDLSHGEGERYASSETSGR
jgi:hypothetical protein